MYNSFILSLSILVLDNPLPPLEIIRPNHVTGCWSYTWGEVYYDFGIRFKEDGSFVESYGARGNWRIKGNVLTLLEKWTMDPPNDWIEYTITFDMKESTRSIFVGEAKYLLWIDGKWVEKTTPVMFKRAKTSSQLPSSLDVTSLEIINVR